jgi:small subunit ribosomal protein S21
VSEIILSDDDRVDWAIKAFRRKVQRSGVLKDLRKKRYFVKPSLARRLKEASAKRRRRSTARSRS